MHLPNLSDLIGEQLSVYEAGPDDCLFVVGPPGSGKTSLAVLRAGFLARLNRRCILVTRNRLLAALANQLGCPEAATMHSFVSRAFLRRFGQLPPEVAPYHYDWDALTSAYSPDESPSGLDHLIIDEGQNLPAPFFRWARRYGARAMTVFADEDQTTDSERSSIEEIVGAGMPRPMLLTRNHRNTAEIADVAEHFHRSQKVPPGVPQRGRGGEKPNLVAVFSWEQAAERMAAHFRNRGGTIGAIVFRKEHVVALHAALRRLVSNDTRVDYYTSNSPEASQTIQTLTPGLTVLTSEAVIGLEFDVVYLQGLADALPCRYFEDYRRMYMLCARARDSLILFNGPDLLSAEQVGALPGPLLLER